MHHCCFRDLMINNDLRDFKKIKSNLPGCITWWHFFVTQIDLGNLRAIKQTL